MPASLEVGPIFRYPNSSTPIFSQVVHRDLAARNMLIGHNKDRATEKRFIVKLGDFGLARQLDEDGVCHTSPEVWRCGFFPLTLKIEETLFHFGLSERL